MKLAGVDQISCQCPALWVFEAINFFAVTLRHVELFQKFFQNWLSSKFVTSGQSNLATDGIAAVHGRFSGPGCASVQKTRNQLSLTNPRDALHYGERADGCSVWWTCDRAKLTILRFESCQFSAISPAFNLPHMHLAPSLWVTPFEFRRDFRRQETRIPGLSCGIVCVILCSAISVEHRLVTDGWTDRHDVS